VDSRSLSCLERRSSTVHNSPLCHLHNLPQDLYCVSTKNHLEHITWPKRSTAIINTSKNITKETAVEYRTAYRESAVVKNALQQRQYTKGTPLC
jgi:hypothetical protein